MYLFDTHALLWAMVDDPRLGDQAKRLFDDGETPIVVSAASIWEIAIKVSLGKLSLSKRLEELVESDLPAQGIPVLGVEARHAIAVQRLPFHHRDPFDRVLAATAQVDRLTMVSRDPVFEHYGVPRIW